MNAQALLGLLLRHALTYGGGALTSKGFLTAEEADVAIGALVALIGLALSAWQKKRAAKKLRAIPVE